MPHCYDLYFFMREIKAKTKIFDHQLANSMPNVKLVKS